jgi:hypothetical protein
MAHAKEKSMFQPAARARTNFVSNVDAHEMLEAGQRVWMSAPSDVTAPGTLSSMSAT